jgi:hypothetical protein
MHSLVIIVKLELKVWETMVFFRLLDLKFDDFFKIVKLVKFTL